MLEDDILSMEIKIGKGIKSYKKDTNQMRLVSFLYDFI